MRHLDSTGRPFKKCRGVKPSAVFADRIVGKPYLLLDINREQISRYGLSIQSVQKQNSSCCWWNGYDFHR
ncbi:MAG: hypothetical protein R2728_08210 [Chitinophagales bacterium]